MKTVVLLAVVAAALLGCAQRYKITLTNGNTLTTSSKPRLNADGNAYVFKDRHGKETAISAGRVTEIEAQ
jgi:type IV pilus biogenesis protein CpaD/CtpE